MNDKKTFNKFANSLALLVHQLQITLIDVQKLPLSKADKALICASLKGEIEYRSKLLVECIERNHSKDGWTEENVGRRAAAGKRTTP